MNIIAMPAFENRDKNPYNWLLYTSMKDLGVKVDEFSSLSLLRNRYAIWHLHWPDGPLNYRNPLKAFLKIQALLLQIDWARSQGVKIVWTVHNLANHEKRYPELETWFWRAFTQRLDGYISLSQMGIQAAQERFPKLSHLPGFVIPHSHYRGEYPDYVSPQEARASLGIPPEAKMLLFFGRIRPYKNVPALIRAFREFPQQEVILYIAGRPEPSTLQQELEKETASDSRIRMQLEFIPDDKAQLYFRAADLVILPYREILNSGSALLALSFDCPVLVPLRGALSELQNHVGEQWIKTYEGEITSAHIEEALKWVLNTPRPKQPPLETLDCKELAQRTIDAYKAIAANR